MEVEKKEEKKLTPKEYKEKFLKQPYLLSLYQVRGLVRKSIKKELYTELTTGASQDFKIENESLDSLLKRDKQLSETIMIEESEHIKAQHFQKQQEEEKKQNNGIVTSIFNKK